MNTQLELVLLSERWRDAGAEGALLTDPVWTERAKGVLERLAAAGVSFTADDVREAAGEPPSPGALGAVFLLAARRGRIRRIGLSRSRRLSRKGSMLSRWVGADAGGIEHSVPTQGPRWMRPLREREARVGGTL